MASKELNALMNKLQMMKDALDDEQTRPDTDPQDFSLELGPYIHSGNTKENINEESQTRDEEGAQLLNKLNQK